MYTLACLTSMNPRAQPRQLKFKKANHIHQLFSTYTSCSIGILDSPEKFHLFPGLSRELQLLVW